MNENIVNILKMEIGERTRFAKSVAKDFKEKLITKYDFNAESAEAFIFDICKLFSMGDRALGIQEKELFNEIMGANLSDQAFIERMKDGANQEFIDYMDENFSLLLYEDRISAALIGLAFICIDGKVNEKEEILLAKMLKD